MKRIALLPSIAICSVQMAVAQQPSQLVGTWNVTSTSTGESNFEVMPKAASSAYIWIVSASPDGSISVSVQGETSFPKLKGKWYPGTRTLILGAQTTSLGGRNSCWFKLVLDDHGVLRGVRRYLDSTPAFIDFDVVAKKS
jgi:hypothetical protein